MINEKDKYEARLHQRRQITPSQCWIYTGSLAGNGYGHMVFEGRTEYTHRIAAVLYLDFDLRNGLCVMHVCDVPACFNPSHLRVGTQADNMRDAAAKGRMTGKKLNEAKVAMIKYRIANGDRDRVLANDYGVSTTAIGQIRRGLTWKDVEPAPAEDSPNEESLSPRSDDEVSD